VSSGREEEEEEEEEEEDEDEDEDEEEWGCDHCDRTFKRMVLAIQHERRCTSKPPPRTVKKKSGECHRCGREGHWVADCYAKKHFDGYDL